MRKRYVMEKMGIFLWTVFLICFLTSCGNDEKNKTETAEGENTYQTEVKEFDAGIKNILDLCEKNGRIYMLGQTWGNGKEEIFLLSCKKNGNDIKKKRIKLSEGEEVYAMGLDRKQQIYIAVNGFDGNENKTGIKILNEKGKITGGFLLDAKGNHKNSEIFISSQGDIYAFDGQNLYWYDQQGVQTGSMDLKGELGKLLEMEDGRIYAFVCKEGTWGFYNLNMEHKKLGDAVCIDGFQLFTPEACMGQDGQLYVSDRNGVYRIDLEKDKENMQMLFRWANIGVETGTAFLALSDQSFFVASLSVHGEDAQPGKLILLKKNGQEAGTGKEETKKTLVLACIGMGGSALENVLAFNEENKEYQIEVKDYSSYENPSQKLNLDIISGKEPDILCLNQLPADIYVKKHILADLYPWMEQDKEISREDFLESVLGTVETDGKLYYMGASFQITSCLAGGKCYFGERKGWNMEEMEEIYSQKPEDAVFLSNGVSNTQFVSNVVASQMDYYVDWKQGKASFGQGNFAKLLNFSKAAGQQEKSVGGNVEELLKKGKLMLNAFCFTFMTDVELYNKMLEPCGGYTVLGYPVEEKDAALTMSFFDPAMAITEQCSDKEGAWKFLRRFFLYDYQMTSNAGGGIPTRKDAFAKKLEYASATEKYTDEDGTEVVPVGTDIEYQGYELKPLTQEEVKMAGELVGRVGKLAINGNAEAIEINQIVQEETEGFFAGDKTAEETADIVQSRVEIYVSENS